MKKTTVELDPEILGKLYDACRRFVSAYELCHETIPAGVEVHMQAPKLLHSALAEVVGSAIEVFGRFRTKGQA